MVNSSIAGELHKVNHFSRITSDSDAVKRVLKNLRTASDDLETIVYEAQKHGTFATIWEQRRTTDTLIKGFVSLEAAVERMGSRMVDAVSKMADDSQLARRETQQALSNVSKSIERSTR